MTKRFTLLGCMAVAVTIAACSSSTSPSNNNTKPPSGASKGQHVDFTGTYALQSYADDSADGGTATQHTDANNGGTLALTSAGFTLTWTGSFAQQQNTHGSYVATDTSSSAQRGTLVLYDSVQAKTQDAVYSYASNTLTISIPNGDGQSGTVVTVWNKQ
jgi:hypothetical protein